MKEPEFLELIAEKGSVYLTKLIELAMINSKKAGTVLEFSIHVWMNDSQQSTINYVK